LSAVHCRSFIFILVSSSLLSFKVFAGIATFNNARGVREMVAAYLQYLLLEESL